MSSSGQKNGQAVAYDNKDISEVFAARYLGEETVRTSPLRGGPGSLRYLGT